jgi:hypothetical protein
MSDLPQLAFYLSAILFYMKGFDDNRYGYFALAGLLAGCAVLSKYTAFTIFLIFVFYNMIFQKSYKRAWLSFLISTFMILLWGLHGLYFYGRPHFLNFSNAPVFWRNIDVSGSVFTNFTELLIFLSGVSLFGFLFRIDLSKENKNIVSAVSVLIFTAAAILTVYVIRSYAGRIGLFDPVFVFLFLTGTLFLFRNCIIYYLKNRYDKIFLFLFSWFFVNAYIVIFLFAVSARFVLMALPPMALLIAYAMGKEGLIVTQKRRLYTGCILILAVSILVAHSDYCLAVSYKRFADATKEKMGDKKVYFTGNWGFQYYMEKRGFSPLDYENASLEEGDIIISPVSNPGLYTEKIDDVAKLIGAYKDENKGLFRVMSKAGFYCSGFGPLPYAPGAPFAEAYLYYNVTKPYKGRLL